MAALTSLFGGEAPQNQLNHGQGRLLHGVTNRALAELGQPANQYTGQLVAGGNQNLSSAFAGMPGVAYQNPNMQGAISSALSGAEDPAAIRAMFQEALGPAQLEFNRAQNQTANRYGDTWGSNGAFAEMMSRGTADYGMGLSQLLGQMTYQDRNAARDRQAGAIVPAAQAQGQAIQGMNALYNMGMAEQGQEQAGLSSEYNRWLSNQWYNNPALGLIAPALGTQQYTMANQVGIVPGTIGAIGGLASIGAGAA